MDGGAWCRSGLMACSVCQETKPLTSEFFVPRKNSKTGFCGRCRACDVESKRRWAGRNREKLREQARALRAASLEKARERGRRLAAEKRRKDPEAERARVREALRRYRERNRVENRPQRVRHNVSSRIAHSLRACLAGRKAGRKWPEILGYDLPALIVHIERQFSQGMTWENWGVVWHIDHILPVSSFRIEAVGCPEFRACWALSNLRPLLIGSNLSKGARRTLLL